MPKVPWSEFDRSTAHLVTGIVADDERPNLLSRLVASLVKHLEPKGEYALTVYRGMGTVDSIAPFGSRPTPIRSPLLSRRSQLTSIRVGSASARSPSMTPP
jgi:hypothetical protein